MPRTANRAKTASIKDVAALSGVSVPTVSRYLNDRERVSEEKRQRIAKAIELLDYRPNPIARALVRERTHLISVLTTDTTLYGQSEMLHGIELRAREAEYQININMITGGSREDIHRSVRRALDQNPVGTILLNYDAASAEASAFLPTDMPVVLVAGNRNPDVAQVSLQENEGGRDVTRHLLSLGHRTVIHVSVPGGSGGYSRLSGWRQALSDAGVFAPEPVMAKWDPYSGREIGRKLGVRDDVTAIFAGNDEIAMGIIRGLGDVGRRVPDDVSVVGFDDHPLARVWDPALTTVRQDFRKAGSVAFDMLADQIDDVVAGRGRTDNWTRYTELPGELVVRESSSQPQERRATSDAATS
ncbi:LacI family DNA-binding transcriptional regulator [Bifidobacterium aesculapii]|uniref:LacI family DNA-binding transcriptional regulator n=1 Tax=Bifidobacterium aesculapii TaxID=1329411 RepID=UPI0006E3F1EC|nr:LacI family DNA-binding transcriptional regulator [Bifidobacterium aesculapii]